MKTLKENQEGRQFRKKKKKKMDFLFIINIFETMSTAMPASCPLLEPFCFLTCHLGLFLWVQGIFAFFLPLEPSSVSSAVSI